MIFLFSYDEDEFGNLDFTEKPKNYQSGIKTNYNSGTPYYNTKRPTTNYYTKTPTKTSTNRRKNPKKDPIRTTMEHFMNLGRYRNSGRNENRNEDIYGLDKYGVWKKKTDYEHRKPVKPLTAYGYRTPVSNRPNRYIPSSELKNIQKTAGKKNNLNLIDYQITLKLITHLNIS